jgi:hypothetical protein
MTAWLIAEWMSFVGWLHTAVRKDSRALALFAGAELLSNPIHTVSDATGSLHPHPDILILSGQEHLLAGRLRRTSLI